LRARILSALVLFPVAIVAIVKGTPYFEIMAVVAALAMAWEWIRVCGGGSMRFYGYLFVAVIFLSLVAAGMKRFDLALVLVFAGAAAVLYAARVDGAERASWVAAGVIAVGIPVMCAIWIEGAAGAGWQATMWLFGAVWATDIGAYCFGRLIGGVRLAPRISPRKTWAGLIGGAVCAALWSVGWGWHLGAPSFGVLVIAGLLAALIAQAGDLGVSLVKRRFGVKDASALIPGHGGVLDRSDGLLGTAPILAIILFIAENGGTSWLGL